MPNPISAVIITKNEAHCIARCIKSLQPVCSDIIVVDSGSTDGTPQIAAGLGATVVSQHWLGFGPQKNTGIRAAKHNYILSVDADECLDETLTASLIATAQNGLKGAYSVRFLHNYYGKFIHYGLENPQWKIRLFNRADFMWDEKEVHESLQMPAGYPVQKLTGRMLHYGYLSVEQHAKKSDAYSTLGAQQLFKKGKRNYGWKLIISPAFTFFLSYILKRGFLDGRTGFVLANWNAYTTFMKYAKLWGMYKNAAR